MTAQTAQEALLALRQSDPELADRLQRALDKENGYGLSNAEIIRKGEDMKPPPVSVKPSQGDTPKPLRVSVGNKYGAVRTWSDLCQRTFDSKAEARHGEELRLRELAGDIRNLEYQVPFVLSEKPKITITIDFHFWLREANAEVFEDVKGVLTRDSRTKLAWLKEQHGVDVKLVKRLGE